MSHRSTISRDAGKQDPGRPLRAGAAGKGDDDIRMVHDGIQRLERLYLGLLNRPPTVRELWGSWSAISTRSGMALKLLAVGLSREARSRRGWMGRLLRTAERSPSAPAIARRVVTAPAIRGLEFLERWRPGIAACEMAESEPKADPAPSGEHGATIGLTLVGYLRADCGLGEAARSFARACVAAGIPIVGDDVGYQIPCRQSDDTLLLPPVSGPLPIDLLYVNADQTLPTRQSLLARGHTKGRYAIGFWHWEQPQIPRRHHAAFSEVDEVWVPSTFVQDAVAPVSPVPVFKVPHVVSVTPSAGASRERFSLPRDRQLVLVMYDFYSFQERKNPQAAIAAYRLAAAQSPSLGLVVKTHNSAANPQSLAEVCACLADLPGVTFIDETLSRQETWDLESCCDILLSLHRAEGFGFGPAEMMALGKPVVATGWSANMDFMDATNSMPVRYELKPLEKTVGPYDAGPLWADADVEHAAWCLGQLAADPALVARLGARARETIRESFDPLVVGRQVRDRLATIARWHLG
jgi:glycosyltransferase involved in cell wall biosynthesis